MTLQREAYNRKPTDELTECFEREGTVICGVVRWTGDRHFSLIQNVLTDLRLYQADS